MDIDRLKVLKQRKIISEEFYIKRIVGFAKHHLKNNCQLDVLKIHEIGSYGGVIIAREKASSARLSAKIVISEKCPEQFIEVWPRLKHPNIDRILEREYIEQIETYVFITECPVGDLETLHKDSEIFKDKNALGRIKRFIWDILEGIDYIHALKYCHLQINSKNILITRNNRALISNFSLIEDINKAPKSVSLNYGPPEMHLESHRSTFCGVSYDIWSIGILALNIFTDTCIQNKLAEDSDWSSCVFPTLLNVIQAKKFSKHVKRAFPTAKISKESKKCMRNFVICCLRILPEDRPSAKWLHQHAYLIPDRGYFTNDLQPWDNRSRARRNMKTPGWFRSIRTAARIHF